ncbi:MAG: undecaprenyl/decaprenyl-phosphate alpha-N-acetylglucosaminyl 1-phosphate transferase, partial [Thermanaerothrix sp.]|nr:undecaprenyl/decaprenyl-phosphate alpha-N-acetylglucosaminyl 1-phosphate transferase [Thermanaerothrix sp.]
DVYKRQGLTNAFNLIDGMDGLCLSMALVTMGCAMYFLAPFPWVITIGLVLGVMIWNFPRAKTFLGDGGSTLLGFLCASLILWDAWGSLAGVGIIRLCITLFLLGGLPVVDTLSVMFGRVLRGASPFLPDRTHGHHRLLDMGLDKVKVLAVLVGIHLSLVVAGMLLLKGKVGF